MCSSFRLSGCVALSGGPEHHADAGLAGHRDVMTGEFLGLLELPALDRVDNCQLLLIRGFRAAGLSNRIQVRPLFASKNDPSDGAKTGVAEPDVAEQSRSWRVVSGEQEVMRGS